MLAAYLLGLDHARGETRAAVANLAEDDAKPVYTIGDNPTLKLRFNVPPAEALDYFRRKKIVTRKEFGDLRHEAQSAAFTVGGIYRQDVLTAFRDEIASALADGTPQAKVIQRFKAILDGADHKMLGDFHLETITCFALECFVRINMRIIYQRGIDGGLFDKSLLVSPSQAMILSKTFL